MKSNSERFKRMAAGGIILPAIFILLGMLACEKNEESKSGVADITVQTVRDSAAEIDRRDITSKPSDRNDSTIKSAAALVPDGLTLFEPIELSGFLTEEANEQGWTADKSELMSYWQTEQEWSDNTVGRFSVCRLANLAEPRGGVQKLYLLVEKEGETLIFGPLISQMPPTNDYSHKVIPGDFKMSSSGTDGSIIELEMQDRVNESIDGGEHIRVTERRLAYLFAIEAEEPIRCLAYQIPMRTAVEIDDSTIASSSLQLDFSEAGIIRIRGAADNLTEEQRAFTGRYRIGGE